MSTSNARSVAEDEQEQPFIHRRVIETDVRLGPTAGTLEAIGRLTDVKGQPVSMYTGELLPAGHLAHDMQVRLVIGDDLVIRAVEVEMAASPGTPCRDIVPAFQNLVGVRVGRGYRAKLSELFGSTRGCTHVLELFNVMGPSIMQATWALQLGEGYDPAAMLDWEGTCHAYAADSPVMIRLRDEASRLDP